MRTSAHRVRASDVFESSLLSSFKKEVVSTQFVDNVRAVAGEPNKIISWVWCFDVSEPDVFIGDFHLL